MASQSSGFQTIWKEFEKFAVRGNLMDLTIGFVIGSAFTKVVNSIVNDIIMPPLGLIVGKVDFSDLYINLSRKHYPNFAAAKQAGAPTINIGAFLNNVVTFFIVATVMFFVVREVNRISALRHKAKTVETAAAPPRKCPYCVTEIDDAATRCPHCTSHLPKASVHPSS